MPARQSVHVKERIESLDLKKIGKQARQGGSGFPTI
jgi:hypothetical protein